MNDSYEDIINLPHHVSKRHRQMPLAIRSFGGTRCRCAQYGAAGAPADG